MTIQDLVNEATNEALLVKYHEARASRLKAAAIAEAERLRLSGAPVRELSSDQRLGSLRLDADGLPAVPVVEKADEVTTWLVDVAPDLIRGVIAIPATRLEEALEILAFAGFTDGEMSARAEFRDPRAAERWVADHCTIQADPDVAGQWNVLHRDEEGYLTPVPGMSARKPTPYWVIRTDDEKRKEWVATAQAEVDGLVAELRGQTAVALHIRDGVPPVTPWQTHSGDDDFPPEDDPAGRVRAEAEATVAERLEARMAAGDPVAAATHAIVVQGGYSTPEIEAERMAADRRVEARILAAGTTRAELDEDLADAAAEDGM